MMKNNLRVYRLSIVILILFLSMTPLLVSCGSSGGGDNSNQNIAPCSAENCTDEQLDDIFVQAITELEKEGLVITLEKITTDQGVYYSVLNRMLSIGGVEQLAQQDMIAGVTPASVDPFEPFDDTIEYCGPGKSAPGGSYAMPHPGYCMNRACWEHDDCYDTIFEGGDPGCSWSSATKFCDDKFFKSYDICQSIDGWCDFKCRTVNAMARSFVNWCDIPSLHPVECTARSIYCSECTHRSEDESCKALGAECGQVQNGCGQTIECAECPQLRICGFFDGMDNKCGNIDLNGTWYDNVGYTVTIEGASNLYDYTGTDGIFLHTGSLKWTGELFEGDMKDVDPWCCGNTGYLLLEVVDQDT